MSNYNILVIFLPLMSFVNSFFFGALLGRLGATRLSLSFLFAAALISWYSLWLNFFNFPGAVSLISIGSWLSIYGLSIEWEFNFDALALVMCVVVNTVSFLVHVFAKDYMHNDPHVIKFFSFISLFTFFMLILVCSNNFLILFLGWEGVGLCSYLLINFWDTRVQCAKSANKALIVNRVGDFFFIAAMGILIFSFESLDFQVVFSLAHQYCHEVLFKFLDVEIKVVDLVSFFLFIAAMAKSAQIFLHTWLPDAMEGPTPVSALIHAATMVTAGVFLVIRCSPLFELSSFTLSFMVYVGAVTIVVSGIIALFQNDLKKIVAYSTCSQLGYMVFACGLSGYNLALFHLFNHAFFKALLFLACGALIHSMGGEQDIRKMGGLHRALPITYLSFFLGSLSLIGFPFFSGFFSKDSIVQLAYIKLCTEDHFHLYFFSLLGVFLTTLYSLRLIFFSFFLAFNGYKKVAVRGIKESDSFFNLFPLMVLSIFSVFSGFFFSFFFLESGWMVFNESVFIFDSLTTLSSFNFIPGIVHFFPAMVILFAIFVFLIFYLFFRPRISSRLFEKDNFFRLSYLKNYEKINAFFNKKFYFDDLYNVYLALTVYKSSYKIFKVVDKGLLEVFGGARGLGSYIVNLAAAYNERAQSGYIYHYTFVIFLSLIALLFFGVVIFSYEGHFFLPFIPFLANKKIACFDQVKKTGRPSWK